MSGRTVRIANYEVPAAKHARIALRYIVGIGPSLAERVLAALSIDPSRKAGELSEAEVRAIGQHLRENYASSLGYELVQKVKANVKAKVVSGSYEGQRHVRRLPVRGQRTSTNSRTARRVFVNLEL